jgi:hypothetical protein
MNARRRQIGKIAAEARVVVPIAFDARFNASARTTGAR